VLEVARITYIYWPNECIPKFLFWPLFKLARIMYIYWPIECTSKRWFVKVPRSLQHLHTCSGWLSALQSINL
jgi:hypothetical protein